MRKNQLDMETRNPENQIFLDSPQTNKKIGFTIVARSCYFYHHPPWTPIKWGSRNTLHLSSLSYRLCVTEMQGPAEKVLLARQGLNTACSLRYIVPILGQRRNSKKPKISRSPRASKAGKHPLKRNPPKKPPLSIEVHQRSFKESLTLHTAFRTDLTLTMQKGK
jgi:hypothetical protein